jgi:esterase/lipase superfamily enzyme
VTCSISRGAKAAPTGSGCAAQAWARITPPTSLSGRPTPSVHLISLSGAFEISDFFDGYHADDIYFNSPYEYLPNMPDPWKYNHMNIILGTGEWDNTRHESMRLSDILNSKEIRHWRDDRKWCGHEWKYWRDMLPYYLSTF